MKDVERRRRMGSRKGGGLYKAYGRIDGVEGNSQTRARLWDSKAKRRGMRKEDNSWSRSLFLL
jgi:hypothetical protein